MKVNGKEVPALTNEMIVIPRGDERMVFEAKMVRDYTECDGLNPLPLPKVKKYPDGREVTDIKDPEYRKALATYASQRNAWLFIESLSATEGLEWSTVKRDEPATWKNYAAELEENNFSDTEVNAIMGMVILANALSQSRIDEATKSFLAERQLEKEKENSQLGAQATT